ncbi:hypothetical protein [Herpetosiphon llansteffanensis]|uniref:hypothetical protein n=1 Tax=Herpetosiphon llansteffanensis TaxID=2094568 RepID=UPI000D7C7B47|nr:hypothetical protein [Herpetosiphon llansteffanensis]
MAAKIKVFSVTREDDAYLAAAQAERKVNEWLENSDIVVTSLSTAYAFDPETDIAEKRHTYTVAVAYTE